MFFSHINWEFLIIPIDFHSNLFQRGGEKPPTRIHVWWMYGLGIFCRFSNPLPWSVHRSEVGNGLRGFSLQNFFRKSPVFRFKPRISLFVHHQSWGSFQSTCGSNDKSTCFQLFHQSSLQKGLIFWGWRYVFCSEEGGTAQPVGPRSALSSVRRIGDFPSKVGIPLGERMGVGNWWEMLCFLICFSSWITDVWWFYDSLNSLMFLNINQLLLTGGCVNHGNPWKCGRSCGFMAASCSGTVARDPWSFSGNIVGWSFEDMDRNHATEY